MNTVLSIVLIIVALLLGGGAVAIGFTVYNQGIVEQFNQEITEAKAFKDSVGDLTTVYVLNTQCKPGQVVTADMVEEMTIPANFINESYVTNIDEIVGKYGKVNILPKTPITADIIMDEDINNERELWHTVREYDIVVNLWPIGLQVGDYVDLRIMLPYGEEYIVLSHLRVNGMSDQTIKVLLTEVQINLYQSALVDYYLNSNQGVMLYFAKYIEPGVQKPATISYKVSDHIMEAMKKNPNLYATAWASVYDATTRNEIEADLVPTDTEGEQTDEDRTATINGGRGTWTGTISGGGGSYTDTKQEEGDDNVW